MTNKVSSYFCKAAIKLSPAVLVLLSACASIEEITDPDTCMDIRVKTKNQDGELIVRKRELIGFNEDCARLQILGLVASASGDGEEAQVARIALLKLVSEEPEIKEIIEKTLEDGGMSLEDVRARSESEQSENIIARLVQNLGDLDDDPNLESVKDLIEISAGGIFQRVPGDIIENRINQQLAEKYPGASLKDLEKIHNRLEQTAETPLCKEAAPGVIHCPSP